MDTLGVIQKKPHTSKLAISSLIMNLIGGLSPCGIVLFNSFVYQYSYSQHVLLYPFDDFLNSLINFLWLLPIAAIVLGILSLWRIHKHPNLLKGKVIAWLGIVLGGLMILAWIGWIWLMSHYVI
jgi:hypothetical protein